MSGGTTLRRLSAEDVLVQSSSLKSSVQRHLKSALCAAYPRLSMPAVTATTEEAEADAEEQQVLWDALIPKKALALSRCRGGPDAPEFYGVGREILFVRVMREGSTAVYLPTLRLVHRYPSLVRRLRVDIGAVPHLLGGSNVFCAGIQAQFYYGDEERQADEEEGGEGAYPAGSVVALVPEGKEHAVGIGVTLIPSNEMRRDNRGVTGVQALHILGDGLWNMEELP